MNFDDRLVMRQLLRLLSVFSLILVYATAYASSPNYTTFQTRIFTPAGAPLEGAAVNFRFTILDSVGTCTLYVEDYAGVNMTGSSGVVSFSLGSGTKSYPAGIVSMYEVFNNSTAPIPCQAGGNFTPGTNDRRQIVMQFNDGSGWQTLPQMAINSVFYSTYASRAEKLGDFVATDYLRPTTLPTCAVNQALRFDGTNFTCVATSSGAGTVTSVGATSPLISSGSTSTPVISLPQASGAAAGYLSSSDWTTFNNKASVTLAPGYLYVGNAGSTATGVQLSGDATLSNSGVLALVNSGVGAATYGSASSVPSLTVD